MTLLDYLNREVQAVAIRIRDSGAIDLPSLRSLQMLLQISKAEESYPQSSRNAIIQAISAYGHSEALVAHLNIIPLSYGGEKDKPA
jgi:hypothetical protein